MIKLNPESSITPVKDFVSEYDSYGFFEADDFTSYQFLGSHRRIIDGIEGFCFTIWAPSAVTVTLVGDFNSWKIGSHPLKKINDYGLWSAWVPNFKVEDKYQYAIQYSNGEIKYICDPYSFKNAFDNRLCSIATNLDNYQWHDLEWLSSREKVELSNKPISIISYDLEDYQCKEQKNFQELAKEIVEEAKFFNATHIELINVFESIVDLSASITRKDKNLSPRESFYYSIKSSFGSNEDFKCFIDYCHQNGIGIVLNLPYFSESNMPSMTHYKSLSRKSHFNFYLSNVYYWLEEYHVDGFNFGEIETLISRVNENEIKSFICTVNTLVHEKANGVFTLASDCSGYPNLTKPIFLDGLGFNMKVNLFWQNEIKKFHNKKEIIDFVYSSINVFAENFILKLDDFAALNQFDYDELKILFGYLFTLPGKKIISSKYLKKIKSKSNPQVRLLEDYYHTKSNDISNFGYTPEEDILSFYFTKLNDIYTSNESLFETDFRESCFEWVNYANSNEENCISFLRWSRDYQKIILVIINFSSQEQKAFRVGVPKSGFYSQIFNSQTYNENISGISNEDGVYSSQSEHDARPYSILVDLAPQSFSIFTLN